MTERLLRDLLPECARALGAGESSSDWLPAGECVVVLLVDGMGQVNLQHCGLVHPALQWLVAAAAGRTATPSTTPVALATLGTGLAPAMHGFVGATFEVPELGCLLRPLKWEHSPDPIAVQPEPTWFERLAATGVAVTRIGPGAYAESGLTRAVLRGGRHVPAESLEELVDETVGAATLSGGLVYAYHARLDKLGHVHGVDSDEWRAELSRVLDAVEALRLRLPANVTLVVTADHGMLDAGVRVWIEDRPGLLDAVTTLAGEPRLRHVYCESANRSRVLRNWQAVSDVADVFSKDDFIAAYWDGVCDEFVYERLGDVIAVTRGTALLASRKVDSRSSTLKGQHGSTSDAECLIPMAVLAG